MNISFTQDEINFRDEVQAFLRNEFPENVRQKKALGLRLGKQDYVDWQQALYKKGWAGINWPSEHGGTGWSATQKYIFYTEAAEFGAPRIVPFGLGMVAPVLYHYGNEEQCRRFLPDILASRAWWCQGYSEPGAGSDLASLKTRAILDGDTYIVNGTKTWTTMAQHADWIFCLVRTDDSGRKQEGISFLLIDMNSPGVTVTPITTIDGGDEINEVHFKDVRVPAGNLVGEAGKGWTYAKLLLTHERTGIARVAESRARFNKLSDLISNPPDGAEALKHNAVFMARVIETEIELKALEFTELRVLSDVSTGRAPGPESSILKIKGSEIQQAIDELLMEVAGIYALPFVPEQYETGFEGEPVGPMFAAETASHYYNNRKVSIYGGSNEIQKNIIARQVLGL